MWDGEKSYPSKTEWLYTCGFIPKLIKHIFLIITPSSLLCSKHKEMKTQFLMSCRPWGKTHKSSRYKITWWFQLILPVLDKQGYYLKKKRRLMEGITSILLVNPCLTLEKGVAMLWSPVEEEARLASSQITGNWGPHSNTPKELSPLNNCVNFNIDLFPIEPQTECCPGWHLDYSLGRDLEPEDSPKLSP